MVHGSTAIQAGRARTASNLRSHLGAPVARADRVAWRDGIRRAAGLRVKHFASFAALVVVAVAGCGGSDASPDDAPPEASRETPGAKDPLPAAVDGGTGVPDASPPRKSKADQLRERLANCTKQASKGLYKTDDEASAPAEIPICDFGEAYFWKADMDIDCDGKITPTCNEDTDDAFQPDTSLHTAAGAPLDASTLPYVVIPSVSSRFNHNTAGIPLGTVVMVVYGDKVEFGVFADTGPSNIIGEASYAMASRLGINPDPQTGGTTPQGAKDVLYVAFKGPGAVVTTPEDHNEAVTVGEARMNAVFPGL